MTLGIIGFAGKLDLGSVDEARLDRPTILITHASGGLLGLVDSIAADIGNVDQNQSFVIRNLRQQRTSVELSRLRTDPICDGAE